MKYPMSDCVTSMATIQDPLRVLHGSVAGFSTTFHLNVDRLVYRYLMGCVETVQ